ncbi:MAG: hypothetical protein ACFBSC_05280 [Microcoleaceae cyanobacterium]
MNEDLVFISPAVGWVLVAGFSLLWVALGMYWGRKNKSFEDHALAGRNIGLALG